jgi:hypothetical protein
MSTANDSLFYNLGMDGFICQDGIGAPNANSQGTAWPLLSAATRVTTSVANGSLILKSILSGEASPNPLMWVINDSPNTIKVFPASGENQNGVANAALSIPSGQSGFFFPRGTQH